MNYKIRLLKLDNPNHLECFFFDTMDEYTKKLNKICETAEQEQKYATFCSDINDFLCNIGIERCKYEVPIVSIDSNNNVFEPKYMENIDAKSCL